MILSIIIVSIKIQRSIAVMFAKQSMHYLGHILPMLRKRISLQIHLSTLIMHMRRVKMTQVVMISLKRDEYKKNQW